METQEDTTDKEKGMILVCNQDINYISNYILYDLAVILLQIIMVSPGTHLVKNHESQSRIIESQFKIKKIASLGIFMYQGCRTQR